MRSTPEISIPTTSDSDPPNQYTIYHIRIRLPLRSFVVSKRYSDFATFHTTLLSQVTAPPPVSLPGKSWFARTVTNPAYREQRRAGLERYLKAINNGPDTRWRNTPAWRAFLNLPSAVAAGGGGPANGTSPSSSQSPSSSAASATASLHAAITTPTGPVVDPTLWLDCHRDLKTHLHDARLQLTRRDQATSPQRVHECSALARSSLLKVGTLLGALEEGLRGQGGDRAVWGATRLGEGELRRRKDLIVSARKERDGLESLLHAINSARSRGSQPADEEPPSRFGNPRSKLKTGRVLGKETDQTRERDNDGVLQLQKDSMNQQDLDVEQLRKAIARQKELGIAINTELELQNEILAQTEEDASRYVVSNSPLTGLETLMLFTGSIANSRA